jgi:hypothetical protein
MRVRPGRTASPPPRSRFVNEVADHQGQQIYAIPLPPSWGPSMRQSRWQGRAAALCAATAPAASDGQHDLPARASLAQHAGTLGCRHRH